MSQREGWQTSRVIWQSHDVTIHTSHINIPRCHLAVTSLSQLTFPLTESCQLYQVMSIINTVLRICYKIDTQPSDGMAVIIEGKMWIWKLHIFFYFDVFRVLYIEILNNWYLTANSFILLWTIRTIQNFLKIFIFEEFEIKQEDNYLSPPQKQ